MVLQSAWQHTFNFFPNKPIIVEPVEAQLTSDAGLLPLRQFDLLIGLTDQFANCLEDYRHPSWTQHAFGEMVRSRIFGIIADYEDQNDHDVLRSDPVFKLIAGRSPASDDLASQPTLSRFENAITVPMLWRLQDVFIDQFIASFDEPPARLTFDIDAYDDPTHGQQQLTFFHGYYKQYQYQPRVITCADNDQVVMACLLFGSAHAALGAGACILPGATYDEYAERGESENRNKELKCGLSADRLSDHRYMANLFRLYLHSAAHNLLIRLRRQIAQPPLPEPPTDLPVAALGGQQRKRYYNLRRDRDPLGEGHPCTWRSRLVKVAAEVVVTARFIRVKLSGCWPYLSFFDQVSKAVNHLSLRPG